MKNIIDLTFELIKENDKTTTQDILNNIDNPILLKLDSKDLEAVVYTDLMTDGRFIKIDKIWGLKKNHTMKEIIKEQYHSIGSIEDLDDDIVLIDEEPNIVLSTDDDDDEKIELDRLDEFQEIE